MTGCLDAPLVRALLHQLSDPTLESCPTEDVYQTAADAAVGGDQRQQAVFGFACPLGELRWLKAVVTKAERVATEESDAVKAEAPAVADKASATVTTKAVVEAEAAAVATTKPQAVVAAETPSEVFFSAAFSAAVDAAEKASVEQVERAAESEAQRDEHEEAADQQFGRPDRELHKQFAIGSAEASAR